MPGVALKSCALAFGLCAGAAAAQQCPAAPTAAPATCEAGVVLRLERSLGGGRGLPAEHSSTFARADRVLGEFEDRTVLEGAVEVRRDGAVLHADRAQYVNATDEMHLDGHVRIFEGLAVFEGPSLDLRLEARTGTMPQATYTYSARGGSGTSRLVEFLGPDEIRLHDATYTTCKADQPAWWITAATLDIHRGEEQAIGHATTLYFEGVPVLASPWFELPLGEQRRSGFLTPGFFQNSRIGQEFIIPFYWNMAPNYDYTITPDLISKRGLDVGNEFRYLDRRLRGILDYDVLPNDRTTSSTRDYLQLMGNWVPLNNLRLDVQFQRVSDDNYLIDFAHNIVSASPTVLPQEELLTYTSTHWNASLQVARSQTLTSLLAAYDPGPYERLPEARWNGTWLDLHGFDAGTSLSVTRFQHRARNPLFVGAVPSAFSLYQAQQTLIDPGFATRYTDSGWAEQDGARLVAHPSVSYPVLAPGWFFVPRAQWDLTEYQLDPNYNEGSRRASRSVPTASLDAGLIFERPLPWVGKGAVQTLEPRVFYAFTPFRDQSRLPNFDSAPADFNFAQLFSENAFTGYDRVSQADQVSLAVSSRVIEEEGGAQLLRLALGQRFYFGSQLVTVPGGVPRTDPSSDVLFSGSAALAHRWNIDLGMDYSTSVRRIAAGTIGLRYQPRPASVINVSYRYENALIAGALIDQASISTQWPVSRHWYAVAALNYSVAEHGWIESLGGIEYNAGCWTARFVTSLYAVPQPNTVLVSNYTRTFFLQLELNGLTSVGQSPLDQLKRSIPGFQRVNPRPVSPAPFDFYE